MNGEYIGFDAFPYVNRLITLGSPHRGVQLLDLADYINLSGWTSNDFLALFDFTGTSNNPLPPSPHPILRAVWDSFKVASLSIVGKPFFDAMHVLRWTPNLPESYRGRIDTAIQGKLNAAQAIFPPAPHPLIAQLAGFYNSQKQAVVDFCKRTPQDEQLRSEKVVGQPATKWMFVESTVPASSEFFPDAPAAAADRRSCAEHSHSTGVSTDCTENLRIAPQCGGNTEIVTGWRVLTDAPGSGSTPKFGGDAPAAGATYVDLTTAGDDVGAHFSVKNPGTFNFGADNQADGVVTRASAVGLGSYANTVHSVNFMPCFLGDGPEAGVNRNHHQLRTPAAFASSICDPDLFAAFGCVAETRISLADYLLKP